MDSHYHLLLETPEPKGAVEKQVPAWWLRPRYTVSPEWIAQEPSMGHPSRVAHAARAVREGSVRELVRLRRLPERL